MYHNSRHVTAPYPAEVIAKEPWDEPDAHAQGQ